MRSSGRFLTTSRLFTGVAFALAVGGAILICRGTEATPDKSFTLLVTSDGTAVCGTVTASGGKAQVTKPDATKVDMPATSVVYATTVKACP